MMTRVGERGGTQACEGVYANRRDADILPEMWMLPLGLGGTVELARTRRRKMSILGRKKVIGKAHRPFGEREEVSEFQHVLR